MSASSRSAGGAARFAATLLVIELSTPAVLAQTPPPQPKVAVRVTSCSEPFASALRRMLEIELGDLLAEPQADDASNLEMIEVVCAAEQARITARGAGGDPPAHNDLRFDAFPSDAAPRAVALAAVEALRAVDPTLTERLAAQAEMHASATPAAANAPISDPVVEAARPALGDETALVAATARPTSIAVGVVIRHFVAAPPATLLGARLELSRRFRAPWDVGLDLDGAMSGQQRVTLGTVQVRALSSGVWLAARVASADWSTSAGLGGRVGLMQLEGAPELEARGHRVVRALVGALFVVRANGAVGPFAFGIAGEGGYAFAGAQGLAGGAPALRLDGLWVAASVNAGVRP